MHGSWISLKLGPEAAWGNRRTLAMMIHGGGAGRLSHTVEIEVEKARAAMMRSVPPQSRQMVTANCFLDGVRVIQITGHNTDLITETFGGLLHTTHEDPWLLPSVD